MTGADVMPAVIAAFLCGLAAGAILSLAVRTLATRRTRPVVSRVSAYTEPKA